MDNKIIVRISNELGNQMFMYASCCGIAKNLKRLLLIDNESAFLSRKNISKYGLDGFNISCDIAGEEYKFLGLKGYLKRKILKICNFFIKKKIFYIEPKDSNKITKFNDKIYNLSLSNNIYLEGYFETEKYFNHIKENIQKEFIFLDAKKYEKSPFFKMLNEKNSVSICLRQNRFIEGKNRNNELNQNKSNLFRDEQINYINRSIDYIKKNAHNPSFYLWSNDLINLDISMFNCKITKVTHDNNFLSVIDKRILDLYLISQCNHHIVIPSSFNWWGAWLSQKNNKIICRPENSFFTNFKINNLDFWPSNWVNIS